VEDTEKGVVALFPTLHLLAKVLGLALVGLGFVAKRLHVGEILYKKIEKFVVHCLGIM
jgi:hypothetical protein